MLAHREFLDDGEPLSYAVPREQDDGVVLSGLRLGKRAVVRVFKQGSGTAKQSIEPWQGKSFELAATTAGRTYVLDESGKAEEK